MVKLAQNKKKTATASAKAGPASRSKKAKNIDLEESITGEEYDSEEMSGDEAASSSAGANKETKSTLLNECKEHFATQDLYEILSLDRKKATQTDSKPRNFIKYK